MTATDALRAPIADSWRRSAMAGLDPEDALEHLTHTDVDRASALLSAASPILDDLNLRLDGTRFTTMLVDREGRVAHRWCDDAGTLRAFDNVGIDVGASLIEEAVGTNAPGTVLETRTSISVNGEEHFAVPLRGFSCYGHPIFHPITRRIEGVLDLSALASETSPLLPAIVARAAADIEQRLLDGSRVSDKQLLAAFQATAGRRRAVVAIGNDLLMSNHAAMDLLSTTDINLLRMIVPDIREDSPVPFTLESGLGVCVRVTRVAGARGCMLMQIVPDEVPRTAAVEPTPRSQGPLLVTGPPGSGRTTHARKLAEARPVTMLTAAAALLDGTEKWARDFNALIQTGQGSVCIDGIDLLPDELLDLVITHVADQRPPRILLVSGPVEGLTGRAAALAGQCTRRVELAPLANRLSELPHLAAAIMRSLDADPSLHLTPGALHALAAQSWPGNLRELRAVIEHVLESRRSGAIVTEDLPEAYRSQQPLARMAPIERAERDAIVAALRAHDGNKVRAAQALGISRTTLYAKMRCLRITVY